MADRFEHQADRRGTILSSVHTPVHSPGRN
jgi:hypothetical protein